MIDGQANVIPVLDGVPLHAVELQEALAKRQAGLEVKSLKPQLTLQEYVTFIGQYLYYFVTEIAPGNTYAGGRPSIMLVPLGAKKPTVFQKTIPEINMLYTYSAACFYQKPHNYPIT